MEYTQEQLEDEYNLKCFDETVKNYRNNPKTYTLEEMKRELLG